MLYFCGKTTFFKYFDTCYTGQGSDLSHDCPKMALKISVLRVNRKTINFIFWPNAPNSVLWRTISTIT